MAFNFFSLKNLKKKKEYSVIWANMLIGNDEKPHNEVQWRKHCLLTVKCETPAYEDKANAWANYILL